MSLIKMSLKHGQSLADAQRAMEQAVNSVSSQFAMLVDSVVWDDTRRHVDILGKGFDVHLQLDEQELHVEGNIAILGKLLGNRVMDGMRKLLEGTFKKPVQIEHDPSSQPKSNP